MRPSKYIFRSLIHAPKEVVSLWHLSDGCFSRSFPSWEHLEILSETPLPANQTRVVCKLKLSLFKSRQVFRNQYLKNHSTHKIQLEKGSFKIFQARVEVKNATSTSSEVLEKVEFLLKAPYILRSYREKCVRDRFDRLFAYKHDVIRSDLTVLERTPIIKPLKILISGSRGLIGSNLTDFLKLAGHDVYTLLRREKKEMGEKEILFDVKDSLRSSLEGFDVVVHLGGSSIQGRWTKAYKETLLESRGGNTKRLSDVLASLESPPKVFLSASAIGFYGDQGDTVLYESAPKGDSSFLAEVCEAWEGASRSLRRQGTRVAHLRFGIVLSSKGGALAKMLPPFRCGLGGPLGNGNQYMSWIAIDDAIYAIYHLMMHKELSGPFNITSPAPVSNREFSKELALFLKKPLGPAIPKWLLKCVKGEMAEELLLASIRAEPKKLLDSGFRFFYPTLKEAFKHLVR